MQKFSYLKPGNADYIDELFEQYLQKPDSIDESWRFFFEGLELGDQLATEAAASGPAVSGVTAAVSSTGLPVATELKVVELIQAYREFGKLAAHLDPLSAAPSSVPQLELSTYGLSSEDLGRTFAAGRLVGLGDAPLSQILQLLKATYSSTIAVEITHIQDTAARSWLQKRLENPQARPKLDGQTQRHILRRMSQAECFERFIHTRYVGAKRFSVEGSEASLPCLDAFIEQGADQGVDEVVIGMAHRGRLNVLHNLFGKKAEAMFTEFEGNYKVDTTHGEGDVKYHKGYSSDITTRNGKSVHLSLAYNPSHLEFVNPVVVGSARARQDRKGDSQRTRVLPILVHGDAALAGQGVCYETFQMGQLEGYTTGGTLHLVINNQVGFTTDPWDSRSAVYSTDVAKMLNSPILHVNGDDPEAVWFVAKLATEYRQTFRQDVFVDLVSYRKYGHNEGDEPEYTQPLFYKKVKAHTSPRGVYAEQLAKSGAVSAEESQGVVDEINAAYMKAQAIAKEKAPYDSGSRLEGSWKGLKQPHGAEEMLEPVKATCVSAPQLQELAKKICTLPAGFTLHSKLGRFFDTRLKSVLEGKGLDWGTGEALAYASLVQEGHTVRITGQDAERGTFTHRHSVVHDFQTGQRFAPFNAVSSSKAKYEVHNSLLSETAVMGYEYGYSLTDPNALTIWEAQFGDFANGAQVIIDQFLATSESKWNRMSGLVLLLPHGYAGQGPEHSSARLERFLQLSGLENWTVANLSTPAQIFHALRRQVKRDFRKPLVIMSPKGLLRHPMAISDLAEFTDRPFQEVLDDSSFTDNAKASNAQRVLLCSGQVYYDLVKERDASKRSDVAMIRVEQLYPWPSGMLAKILGRYGKAEVVWVQEEPRNMGAWTHVFNLWMGGTGNFSQAVGNRAIRYVGRGIAASPATGYPQIHDIEQKALLQEAFKS